MRASPSRTYGIRRNAVRQVSAAESLSPSAGESEPPRERARAVSSASRLSTGCPADSTPSTRTHSPDEDAPDSAASPGSPRLVDPDRRHDAQRLDQVVD